MIEYRELKFFYAPLQIDRAQALHRVMQAVCYFEEHQGCELVCIDKGNEQTFSITPQATGMAKRIAWSLYQDLCLTGESGKELANGIIQKYVKKNNQKSTV